MNTISQIVVDSPAWILAKAQDVVSDMLHVPDSEVSQTIAVAYIQKHYGEGCVGGPRSQGWEGFLWDIDPEEAESVYGL